MKKVILAGLFFIITAFIISLTFTTKTQADTCHRYLNTTVWECYWFGGNCCDDVIIYG